MRIVTYNIHKCRGLDGRVRPERIVQVLREIDADVIALQEVVSVPGRAREDNQAQYIADALGLGACLGANRSLRGGVYGNMLLSRYRLGAAFNYDISSRGREQRGCLRVDFEVAGTDPLHVFNVHLGTAFVERRDQGRKMLTSKILNHHELRGARIVLGDFNEWTPGLATRLLSTNFESADIRRYLRRSRTYPGLLPFLHLDHIYFDPVLQVEGLVLHRSRTSLIASDHLPLVADFRTVHQLNSARMPLRDDQRAHVGNLPVRKILGYVPGSYPGSEDSEVPAVSQARSGIRKNESDSSSGGRI